MTEQPLVIVDAHVHFHSCFDTEEFLDAAYANFAKQLNGKNQCEFVGFLMLTESAWEHWFESLVAISTTELTTNVRHAWQFLKTAEPCSLKAQSQHRGSIYIIAGRQIVTKERIEVLALGTEQQFVDGNPTVEVINDVKRQNAVPVIPWGFGKWYGHRGQFLRELIDSESEKGIFLGDNSGRVSLLPYPSHFSQAIRHKIKILPGTDPLPFSSEGKRPGKFGFVTKGEINDEKPAESIINILRDRSTPIEPYGNLENPLRFLRNQVRMQIVSRTRPKSTV